MHSSAMGNFICKRSNRNCISLFFSPACIIHMHASVSLWSVQAYHSRFVKAWNKQYVCVCVCVCMCVCVCVCEKTPFLVDILQINLNFQPEDQAERERKEGRRDAPGPLAAEKVTVWFSSHSHRGASQSVDWWQCESGLLQTPTVTLCNWKCVFWITSRCEYSEAWALENS